LIQIGKNALFILHREFNPYSRKKKPMIRKYRTVQKALSGLPELGAGDRCENDPLHMTSGVSDLNMRRLRASTPGGTWRDWPEELIADCHKKKSGKTYPGVYGRMEWDAPSPTITTQFFGFGNGRFGHPQQDRAISLREGAILQSFPRKYRFVESGETICFKSVGRLIGNAVPVKLGEAIGRSIVNHVKSHQPTATRKSSRSSSNLLAAR
jgi:DNA (cytosine-5)-methyltransferase 1